LASCGVALRRKRKPLGNPAQLRLTTKTFPQVFRRSIIIPSYKRFNSLKKGGAMDDTTKETRAPQVPDALIQWGLAAAKKRAAFETCLASGPPRDGRLYWLVDNAWVEPTKLLGLTGFDVRNAEDVKNVFATLADYGIRDPGIVASIFAELARAISAAPQRRGMTAADLHRMVGTWKHLGL
jgi:hypothetical protein